MLYTVECDFNDENLEAEWNDFYSVDKLPKLISVQGFLSSQRFKKIQGTAPTYLAIHTIAEANILSSEEYRIKGGGNFAKWQTNITHWQRNLYDYTGGFPDVALNQILVIFYDSLPNNLPINFTEIKNTGLDKSYPQLWYAVLNSNYLPTFSATSANIYQPLTVQLTS